MILKKFKIIKSFRRTEFEGAINGEFEEYVEEMYEREEDLKKRNRLKAIEEELLNT